MASSQSGALRSQTSRYFLTSLRLNPEFSTRIALMCSCLSSHLNFSIKSNIVHHFLDCIAINSRAVAALLSASSTAPRYPHLMSFFAVSSGILRSLKASIFFPRDWTEYFQTVSPHVLILWILISSWNWSAVRLRSSGKSAFISAIRCLSFQMERLRSIAGPISLTLH